MTDLHRHLNPEQKKVIATTTGVVLVVSGPGTGKTTTIQHYIAELIHQRQIDPAEILAVTFTNKAAGEMKKRVAKMAGQPPEIATIHSFAAGVLRKYPPQGYSRGFQIADDPTQFMLAAQLVKRLGIEAHPRFVLEKMTLARNLREKKILTDEGLDQFYQLYMKELMTRGLMDYDGLLTWCVHVFENNLSAREFYQDHYQHVLVDEFQDVSPIQYLLIWYLVAKKRNLLAVGDFDQSIYKFRGADVNIMLNLAKDFPEAVTLFLERNYRSTPSVIKAANYLIKNNHNRRDKALWTRNPEGIPPRVLSYADDRQEAEGIAAMIMSAVDKGRPYSDFAILYRVHTLSRVFEEVFANRQIPYQIIGGSGFFQRSEIKYFLPYFQAAAEEPAPETKLEAIYERILRETGYLSQLKKDKSSVGEKRLESVEELRSLLTYFDQQGKTAAEFLAFVQSTHPDNAAADTVKMMTVHGAKGLEFPVVFVVGAEKGMFPYYGNSDSPEDIEEERRLFYVAITRPQRTLYLTHPFKRTVKGRERKVKPSRFIEEMGLARNHDAPGQQEIGPDSLVNHPRFGQGSVVEIINDAEEKWVRINFIKYGLKKLPLSELGGQPVQD